MMTDYQLAVRAEVFKHELYRNPQEPELLVDRLPARSLRPSWRDAMLLKFGNLLISTGIKLKNNARPLAALSQEML